MEYINGSELPGKRFVKMENGDLREVKSGKFIPGDGDTYWYVDHEGHNYVRIMLGDDHDFFVVTYLPTFCTEEECEEYRRYLEALNQHTFEPNWEDEEQEKWILYYDHRHKRIFTITQSAQMTVDYFPTKESVQAFIDEVGEDAVKRFMFDIWE